VEETPVLMLMSNVKERKFRSGAISTILCGSSRQPMIFRVVRIGAPLHRIVMSSGEAFMSFVLECSCEHSVASARCSSRDPSGSTSGCGFSFMLVRDTVLVVSTTRRTIREVSLCTRAKEGSLWSSSHKRISTSRQNGLDRASMASMHVGFLSTSTRHHSEAVSRAASLQ
jgi:hypothetical protein